MTYIILNPNDMVPFRRILYIPMKQNKIRRERNWLKLLKSAILATAQKDTTEEIHELFRKS